MLNMALGSKSKTTNFNTLSMKGKEISDPKETARISAIFKGKGSRSNPDHYQPLIITKNDLILNSTPENRL